MASVSTRKPADTKPWKKERRVYIYDCTRCRREKVRSYSRSKARQLLCRICRKNQIHPGQLSIFEKSPDIDAGLEGVESKVMTRSCKSCHDEDVIEVRSVVKSSR